MFASAIDNRLPLWRLSINRRQAMCCLAGSHKQIGICGGAICCLQNMDDRHPKIARVRVIGAFDKALCLQKTQRASQM